MDTIKKPRWHRFSIACYDAKAAEHAQLVGKDPENTDDIWVPTTIDLNHVIAIRAAHGEDTGTWLHLSNHERMRIDIPFDEAVDLICQ